MRRLLGVLGLAAAGGVGGLLLAFFLGALVFGASHTGVFDTFFLSFAGAIVGAVGLPLCWYRRTLRNRQPWEL
jgi:hypothetical protein